MPQITSLTQTLNKIFRHEKIYFSIKSDKILIVTIVVYVLHNNKIQYNNCKMWNSYVFMIILKFTNILMSYVNYNKKSLLKC